MDWDTEEPNHGLGTSRPRTFSQQSSESFKTNFPLMTCDSGLYTCSSNTSDCSLPTESDVESLGKRAAARVVRDERLQLAMQDARKLRSELERLTKSEQWYKQELKQQKSTRLEDLERIYTQERKFMQENQRLQKECVRLYEKCTELEKELEKQRQETSEQHVLHHSHEEMEENFAEFEKEQQHALIKDQQQLISVLRKQKRALLEDLRSLTEEKDDQVMELQRLLADLEFDNKCITKKCTQYVKERSHLENNLKQSEAKLSLALEEKLNLQKTLVDLKEQLEIQQELVKLKENEISHIQQHYTDKIQKEEDLDQVHQLSIKYQEEINHKTLEIIQLKERLNEMQDELEDVEKLQQQNEQQQRHIEQLQYSLEAFQKELLQLKASDEHKNQQLNDLQLTLEQLLKDKEVLHSTELRQQSELFNLQQELSSTKEQYLSVLELYKKTQFQMDLLEIDQSKAKFQSQSDHQEIEQLRQKLKEYLQQTAELSEKIQILELELQKAVSENVNLKSDAKAMKENVRELKEKQLMDVDERDYSAREDLAAIEEPLQKTDSKESLQNLQISKDIEKDEDFLKLRQESKKMQDNLERLNDDSKIFQGKQTILQVLQDFMKKNEKTPRVKELKQKNETVNVSRNSLENESLEKDSDLLHLTQQSNKLLQNLDRLNEFFQEKEVLVENLNSIQHSKKSMEKLVIENEILKKKLAEIETEALTLQLKQDINEKTQKCTNLEENLEKQKEKILNLQEKLLENDSNLYKLEKKLKVFEETDYKIEQLQKDNSELRETLLKEQSLKNDLNKKLLQESDLVKELKQNLQEIKLKRKPCNNIAVQCDLEEDNKKSNLEVEELKTQILSLQEQQRNYLQTEALRKEERLQLLRKLMDLQNSKMQNVQKHQEDWEDMLRSLSYAQSMEEQMRKELELKRMELEELNQVFAEQNEELRKLEEFTALLDCKRKQEKEILQKTFQKEKNIMQQQLKEYQNEIEQQKLLNLELEKRNERILEDYNEDYACEIGEYKKEIRLLKSKHVKTLEENEDLLEQLKELEDQAKDLNDYKRQALYMPELVVANSRDNSKENSPEDISLIKQTISEDHLRLLTKVLESEYQRKMLRYDEHIHSLLSNVKSLKKSLRANEEKTMQLSEEQSRTSEELKDLHKTKRNLEELRAKYEQSQNTIKDLKQALAYERKKFELSDIGKSSQNNGTISSYEVSNLIDDYKKLIQQSALATKRPATSAILDLIQRSNQCVPNLQKLETNVVDLRSDLQNFLTSYNQKMPVTSFISAASLTVPPSLMDELRVAASDGF